MSTLRGHIAERLINRNFARLWYGEALSNVGDYAFDTTLVLWVATKLGAGQAWAPIAVSGLLLAAVFAIVFVGPIAGVWVDRWDHKRTMLGTEAIRAGLAGLMALISLIPQRDLPVGAWLFIIFALVFLLNSVGQFFNPARVATIGRVVDSEHQTKAFGIGNATTAIAGMIGPPLAAPLLFTAGVTWALLLNAASYAVSYIAVRSVLLPKTEPTPADASADTDTTAAGPGFRAEFVEGLRFLVRDKGMFGILIIAMVAQAGTGALNTLDVFFVTRNLHVAAKFFGMLALGGGAGLILGSLIAATVVKRLGASRTVWLGLVAGGALFVLYSRQTSFAAGFVLGFLFLIPIAVINTALSPILLALVPQTLFGRVMASFGMLNQGTQMLSMIAAGTLASSSFARFHARIVGVHLGPIDTILSVSGLLILLSGAVAYLTLPRGELDSSSAGSGTDVEPAAA